MALRILTLIAIALTAAGCAQSDPYGRRMGSSAPAPTPTPQQAQSSVAQPAWMKPADYRDGGPVPAMESNRKINEQTCTQGVDLTAGNLRCK